MRKKTLQLFQLFFAIFGFYAAYMFSGTQSISISITCLILIFLFDKVETTIEEKVEAKEEQNDRSQQSLKSDTHLVTLLYNKNVLSLKDTLQRLLRELTFGLTPTTDYKSIDYLLTTRNSKKQIGIKVVGDLEDITPEWKPWKYLKEYRDSEAPLSKIIIIANNWDDGAISGKEQFKDFSEENSKSLSANQIIGMTTLAFYKIYRLCTEKGQNPENFFLLFLRHSGGVFKLEDYIKKK